MVYSLCLMRQRWNITSRQSLLRHLSWTAATLSFATRTTYATTNIESSIQKPSLARHFFIIQQESGKIRRDLPLWASKVEDPFGFGVSNETCQARTIERREVDQVPGAFQLINFMTPEETKRIVDAFNELGFTEDAAVSLPRSVRHNMNLVWIADNTTLDILWNRCRNLFYDKTGTHFLNGRQPLGLNGRFRVYKYTENDYFQFH